MYIYITKNKHTMTRIETIQQILNEKGISNEITNGMFGFRNKGQHTYHWFNIQDDGTLWFNHSYSMNTGYTKKGFHHKWAVEENLRRLTGWNPY